jgi:tellurite resistance protein TerC
MIEVDEPVIEPEQAEGIPAGGPEAAAEVEARLAAEAEEERTRR